MAKGRRSRMDLRREAEAIEARQNETADEREDEAIEDEEDETDAEEAESDADEGTEDDGVRSRKKKGTKKSGTKKATAKRPRAPKEVRLRAFWVVYDNSNKPVEKFPFKHKAEAEALLARKLEEKKGTYFLNLVKEEMKDE